MPLVVPRIAARANNAVVPGTVFIEGVEGSHPRRLPFAVAADWHWVRGVAVEHDAHLEIPGSHACRAASERFRAELLAQEPWRTAPRVLRELQTVAVALFVNETGVLTPYEFGVMLELGLAREDNGYQGVELVPEAIFSAPGLVPVLKAALEPATHLVRNYLFARDWCVDKLLRQATAPGATGHRARLEAYLTIEIFDLAVNEKDALPTPAARVEALRESSEVDLRIRKPDWHRDGVAGVVADLFLGVDDQFNVYGVFVPKILLRRGPASGKPRENPGFSDFGGLYLGRIDSGSFLGTSRSFLHEFSRSGHKNRSHRLV